MRSKEGKRESPHHRRRALTPRGREKSFLRTGRVARLGAVRPGGESALLPRRCHALHQHTRQKERKKETANDDGRAAIESTPPRPPPLTCCPYSFPPPPAFRLASPRQVEGGARGGGLERRKRRRAEAARHWSGWRKPFRLCMGGRMGAVGMLPVACPPPPRRSKEQDFSLCYCWLERGIESFSLSLSLSSTCFLSSFLTALGETEVSLSSPPPPTSSLPPPRPSSSFSLQKERKSSSLASTSTRPPQKNSC